MGVAGGEVESPVGDGAGGGGGEGAAQGRGVAEQGAADGVDQDAELGDGGHVDDAGRVVAGGEDEAVAFDLQAFRLGPGGELLQAAGAEDEGAGAFQGAFDGGEAAGLAEGCAAFGDGGEAGQEGFEGWRVLSRCRLGAWKQAEGQG